MTCEALARMARAMAANAGSVVGPDEDEEAQRTFGQFGQFEPLSNHWDRQAASSSQAAPRKQANRSEDSDVHF